MLKNINFWRCAYRIRHNYTQQRRNLFNAKYVEINIRFIDKT